MHYVIQRIIKITTYAFAFLQKQKIQIKKYNSIIILCGAGIGDAIMATPVIELINLFEIRLTVISNNANADVFKYNSMISKKIIYNRHFFSIVKTCVLIFFSKSDIFIGCQPSNTVAHSVFAFSSFSKIKAKINKKNTLPYADYDFIFDMLIPNDLYRHRVDLNFDIIQALGLKIDRGTELKCKMYIPESMRLQCCPLNFGIDYVVIHPGGGGKQKLWPIINFSKIVNHFNGLNKIVVIVGGIEEWGLFLEIEAVQHQKMINLIGKLNLSDVFQLLQQSQLIIANDTGIMHLSVAAKTQIIALFGHTNPHHIGPYTHGATVMKKDNIHDILAKDVIEVIIRHTGEFAKMEINNMLAT